MGMSHSWWRILVWQLTAWYVWGCLAVLIFRLGQWFPLEPSFWKRHLPVHLLSGSLISAGYFALYTLITMLINPFDVMGNNAPFAEQYRALLRKGLLEGFLVYWTILGISYGFDYYRKYRERELHASRLRLELAQAQLQSLKMQLHPHFLFNTLNGVVGLVRTNENGAAIQMLVGLSNLLRHVLANSDKQEVSLQEELEFLELYLEIQRMRFSDRLQVRRDVDPTALAAQVPNLILQPLVENAIRHGIAQRLTPGTIGVEARIEDKFLKLKIYDDGPGLRNAGQSLENGQGIGLANTRARLENLYGAKHTFEICNRKNGGAKVNIVIPLNFNPEETGNTK